MSWSPAQFLRPVAEGLMTTPVVHTRAGVQGGVPGYYPIDYGELGLKGRIRPPGLGMRDVRQVAGVATASGHAKSPIATLYLPASTNVRHKDRFVVEGRTFDAVSLQTPNSEVTKLRVAIREVCLPERELWLALKPEGYDGAGVYEGVPELLRVLPVPFITDQPVEMVNQDDQVSRLKQLDIAEISREALSDANVKRLLYCLIVMTGTVPTPADAAKVGADRVYTRYRFNGAPALENYGWATDFPYRVGLVETQK